MVNKRTAKTAGLSGPSGPAKRMRQGELDALLELASQAGCAQAAPKAGRALRAIHVKIRKAGGVQTARTATQTGTQGDQAGTQVAPQVSPQGDPQAGTQVVPQGDSQTPVPAPAPAPPVGPMLRVVTNINALRAVVWVACLNTPSPTPEPEERCFEVDVSSIVRGVSYTSHKYWHKIDVEVVRMGDNCFVVTISYIQSGNKITSNIGDFTAGGEKTTVMKGSFTPFSLPPGTLLFRQGI